MSNQGGNSYNLRETTDSDERNWRAQMEHRMSVMAEMYQKAIHDMRSAQDQRLADMAQSQKKNMARIPELMQQGNTRATDYTYPTSCYLGPTSARNTSADPASRGKEILDDFIRGQRPTSTQNTFSEVHTKSATLRSNSSNMWWDKVRASLSQRFNFEGIVSAVAVVAGALPRHADGPKDISECAAKREIKAVGKDGVL
ncbi:hypothetical protein Syun_017917 [Stephania yunnanensis]|uniref:Uncharacterized protein n=1 Tax=Stephania yunnanensis TaxID=152371 RepID=A0AAP0ISD2_9MAGN